jgi:hypothetical protein
VLVGQVQFLILPLALNKVMMVLILYLAPSLLPVVVVVVVDLQLPLSHPVVTAVPAVVVETTQLVACPVAMERLIKVSMVVMASTVQPTVLEVVAVVLVVQVQMAQVQAPLRVESE